MGKVSNEYLWEDLIEEIKKLDYFENDIPFSTGIMPLDTLLNGGLVAGINQLVGESNCGKTTISLQIAKAYCEKGKNVLCIDTKGDITKDRLEKMDLIQYLDNKFIYIRESTFNVVEKTLNKFISTDKLSLVIIDSIADLLNDNYINLDGKTISSDNYNTGYNSKPLSIFIGRLETLAIKKCLTFLVTNQFRNKIRMYGPNGGTIKKIYGPKAVENKSRNIIYINDISEKNEICKDFKNRFICQEKRNIGKSYELEVYKGINSFNPIPYFFVYGEGYSLIHSAVFKWLKDNTIIQNGTYFELAKTNIKAKGISNFMAEVSNGLAEVNLSNNQSLIDYYKSLLKS